MIKVTLASIALHWLVYPTNRALPALNRRTREHFRILFSNKGSINAVSSSYINLQFS